VTCFYDRRCIVDLKTLQMRLAISMLRDCRGRADLVLDGSHGCCPFDGAARRFGQSSTAQFAPPPLYRRSGSRRRIIENEPISVPRLKFDLGNLITCGRQFWQQSWAAGADCALWQRRLACEARERSHASMSQFINCSHSSEIRNIRPSNAVRNRRIERSFVGDRHGNQTFHHYSD